jgi:hypothetical protein
MSIDPSKFHRVNVADTCAVWNALSSKVLYAAASDAGCVFCVTSFVEYELIVKPRKSIKPSEQELINRLTEAKRRGNFETHSCTITDLLSISNLESRKSLGKGELSSIAFAMKTHQAFISDDRKATALARDCGHSLSQTTPHLFAWLVFTDRLGNSDKSTVISQHNTMERPLAPHFERAYEMALHCKLMASQ